MNQQIDAREFLDRASLRPIHYMVLGVCFLTAVVDGLDTQAIGFSAPAIAAEHGLSMASFGIIFSAGTFATLIGAALVGPLADKFGRRPLLIISTIVFGVFTALTAYGTTVEQLSTIRFFGGIGLGGAIPCFLTLVSEYAPAKRKGLATGLLWCGYPLGGMIGGLIGSRFIASGDWQITFFVGGAVALLAAILQWAYLPESLSMLLSRTGNHQQAERIVARVDPSIALSSIRRIEQGGDKKKVAIGQVFAAGRAGSTLMIWVALFMTFMMTKFMVLWMPGLLKTAGMPLSTAALMLALANAASLPSMAAAGYLLDRVGPYRMLPVAFGLLATAFAVLAGSLAALPVVSAMVIIIGFLQGPGIAGMLHITASRYPLAIRSTGVGLAMGVGRSGQVASSAVVAGLLLLGLGVKATVLLMIIPPIIALACVILLGRQDFSGAGSRHSITSTPDKMLERTTTV